MSAFSILPSFHPSDSSLFLSGLSQFPFNQSSFLSLRAAPLDSVHKEWTIPEMIFHERNWIQSMWYKEERGRCRRKERRSSCHVRWTDGAWWQPALARCLLFVDLVDCWWKHDKHIFRQMLQTVRHLIHVCVDECFKHICFHTPPYHFWNKRNCREASGPRRGWKKEVWPPTLHFIVFLAQAHITSLDITHTHTQCHWPFVQCLLHIVAV